MSNNDTQGQEATREFVRERALPMVIASLSPVPFLVLPFTMLTSTLLRNDASTVRLGWWMMSAVLTTTVSILALYRFYMRRDPLHTSRLDQFIIAITFVLLGTHFGICPWVAGGSSVEVTLLFALFPATMSALGCTITSGRRDLYLAFVLPLMAFSSTTLARNGDTHVRGLAVISVFIGIMLIAFHHVISKNTVAAIRLQWRNERLLADLAHEKLELHTANDKYAASNRQLSWEANHDPLTKLYNRRGTLDELDKWMSLCDEDHPVGLLFCDLDRFKAVNDALGHRGGDRFISVIADRLGRSLEREVFAGRMGGDEFVVVLPGLDMGATAAVANRLVGVLAQPVYAEGREMPSSVSIGVACAPQHGLTASELLRHANAALYRAKDGGRNRVELFDGSMQRELVERLEGEQTLRRAIDDGEIVAFFQPEIDATTGQVVGAELLARWVKRTGEVVSASDFLAAAKSASLLERITDRVIANARPHMRRLALLGLPEGFRFRVNMAPEVTDRSWRDDPINNILQGIDPAVVTIDVHEGAVSGDMPAAAANLASFRARGGRVCLDDFARGVSSLNLLRRLPLDEVRIDRLSIDTINAHPHDRAIVRSIIALVREIGLAVTADGVESGAQADALIALGCVRQQGHHYAPAMPAGAFEDFLITRMAERYAQAATPQRSWHTDELD
ncbi:MAG: EAL domain-containing protein [Actinomycetota bacterium]